MAMSRKHYQSVAQKLAEHAATEMNSASHLELVRDIANDLADVFEADNPNFDRIRFLKACGV